MAVISILNDVIGPVMRGPSSSHTAGAHRIAALTKMLSGGKVSSVRIAFDPDGSYAPTYKPLGVDLAFAAAFLGWDMVDERYHEALAYAASSGPDLQFEVTALERPDHPNTVRLLCASPIDASLEVWARSVGGGMVEIYRVNGTPCLVDGTGFVLLALCTGDAVDAASKELSDASDCATITTNAAPSGLFLVQCTSNESFASVLTRRLMSIHGVKSLRLCDPVLHVRKGDPVFTSGRGFLDFAQSEEWSLGRSAIAYESQVLGIPEEQLRQEMLSRYAVMRRSVEEGMDDSRVNMPLTKPSASTLWKAAQAGRLPFATIESRAAIRSLAVLHSCNSRRVVCAAPTGGSAGVIPGVLVTLAEQYGLSDHDISSLLFCAGGIGAIMAMRATFAAEEAGCQVEIGIAGAMAAAMLVEHAGGTAAQCAAAASMSLQNTMGMTCDPVGGGCEIPCHTRTASAASGAFTSADLAIGGYPNPISLDDAIDASYYAGKRLPVELRCTALGGLATTPSALRLVRASQDRDEQK